MYISELVACRKCENGGEDNCLSSRGGGRRARLRGGGFAKGRVAACSHAATRSEKLSLI